MPSKSKSNRKFVLPALALTVLFFVSFLLGRYPVSLSEVFSVLGRHLTGRAEDTMQNSVIWNMRLPRMLLACLVGCCLSAAGAAYQGVFQNPMAAPDLLGATSGAAFGAALAILLGAAGQWITGSAFFFSMLAVLLAFLIGQRARGKKTVNLILAGVMVSSLFSAGTSYLKLVADPNNQLPAITYWLMGSLNNKTFREVGFAAIPALIGLLPLLLLRWQINVLTFGDEEARAMGVHPALVRLIVILSATLITAGCVAVSGVIGWIGLVIPHFSRRYIGNDYRLLLPCSMLGGAVFLLLVDDLSRNLQQTEIPLGILTALTGVPFFIYLMLGEEKFE
ncbi:MAG: iron ABC transporter permease [Oscillospiraceae bacterium]|nr:iron ABC transporter permease [Oscillospiraceae bacterium]